MFIINIALRKPVYCWKLFLMYLCNVFNEPLVQINRFKSQAVSNVRKNYLNMNPIT